MDLIDCMNLHKWLTVICYCNLNAVFVSILHYRRLQWSRNHFPDSCHIEIRNLTLSVIVLALLVMLTDIDDDHGQWCSAFVLALTIARYSPVIQNSIMTGKHTYKHKLTHIFWYNARLDPLSLFSFIPGLYVCYRKWLT